MKTITIWTCDICGKESPWTETHEWFGSRRDFEEKGRKGIIVVCSEECKRKVEPK
jgi:hypothetical protein